MLQKLLQILKQPPTNTRKWLFYMAAPGRFERPAYRLGGGCSIQLSYGAGFKFTLKVEEAENLTFWQTLAAFQKVQLCHKGTLDNFCTELFYELNNG